MPETMKVEITLLEPLLGTLSGDAKLAEEYILSKHPDGVQEDEQEALPAAEDVKKSSTVFARNTDDKPILWDYMFKGFFKDACSALRRVKGTKSSKLTAYKKIVDGLIFVSPRQVLIDLGGDLTFTERPLRAQTAQGERIALARSETAPAGSKLVIGILILDEKYTELVIEWLDYGRLKGLGQWRNSGCGRFTYKLIEK